MVEPSTVLEPPVILVFCLLPLSSPLDAKNVVIAGGARIKNIGVQWAMTVNVVPIVSGTLPGVSDAQLADVNQELQASGVPIAQVLLLRPTSDGDFSTYTLKLVDSSGNPPTGFDPIVSQVDFGFKVECPSDFDCLAPKICPPSIFPEPVIDYMTKDYQSFRTLMLNRLSLLAPDWTERHAADMGNALVEILAYVGDQLSYYQDAVATEAYLGTARQRISVRRHARLLDYFLHDGCNARAWVVMDVDPTVGTVGVPGGTVLLTGGTGFEPLVKARDLEAALAGAQAFQTMYDVTFYSSKNKIQFYAWGDPECCIPAGATRATLSNLNTTAGAPSWVASTVGDLDVMVFQWIDAASTEALRLTKFLGDRYNLDWMTQWGQAYWSAITTPGPDSDALVAFLVQALNVTWIQGGTFTQNVANPSEVDVSGTDASGHNHTLSLTMNSNSTLVDARIDGGPTAWSIPVTSPSAGNLVLNMVNIRMRDSIDREIVISHNEHFATITLSADNRGAATVIDGSSRDEFVMVDANEPPNIATMVAWAHTIGSGDVLIFEEVLSPTTGKQADADPTHRAAVRLTGVSFAKDPLGNVATGGETAIAGDTYPVTPTPLLEVHWDEQDSLPFTLCLEDVVDLSSGTLQPVSVARGNVVLADNGLTKYTGIFPSQGYTDPNGITQFTEFLGFTPSNAQPFRPVLQLGPLTQWVKFDPFLPAVRAFEYSPRDALPAIRVLGDGDVWSPAHDLLASDQFSKEFVVETNNYGTAELRFGDNDYGQAPQPSTGQPGNPFFALYRYGNGIAGNVGREAINLVAETPAPPSSPTGFPVWVVPRQFTGQGITKVRNPMSAQGGVDPESIEDVRQFAPQAFRVQERAVTPADYESVLLRYQGVKHAFAERRWTGSWWTYFISVDRAGGAPVDESFKEAVLAFLDGYRLAGYDLEITNPTYAPLDISIFVCLSPGFSKSDVEQRLLEAFSNKILPDGTNGFFYPDNFSFGQPVYLSKVYERALSVAGVNSVEVLTFQRAGRNPENEVANGAIEIAPSEIARLDNDPDFQENGIIQFTFGGGS